MTAPSTKEYFLTKANEKHLGFYDYSKVVFINSRSKVEIVCPIHGSFFQSPANHYNSGCTKCGIEKSRNAKIKGIDEFLLKSIKHYGDRYDYSKVKMKSFADNVTIVCKIHGDFTVLAERHALGKGGCIKCRNDNFEASVKQRTFSKKEFVDKSNKVHNSKYTYDKSIYISNSANVIITCKTHGDFSQRASTHMDGAGCQDCGIERSSINSSFVKRNFKERFQAVHGDRYSYDKSIYNGYGNNLIITCKIHGDFEQSVSNHLSGAGCPKCNRPGTKLEGKIKDLLDSLEIPYVKDKWFTTNAKKWEVDFYIPKYNLGIECHGNYWHSEARKKLPAAENSHLSKYKNAKLEGFEVFQFFEDEINGRFSTIENILINKIEPIVINPLEINKNISGIDSIDLINKFFYENSLNEIPEYNTAMALVLHDEIISITLFNGKTIVSHLSKSNDKNILEQVILKSKIKKVKIVINNMNESISNFINLGLNEDSEISPSFKYVAEKSNSQRLNKPDPRHKYRIWDAGKTVLTI